MITLIKYLFFFYLGDISFKSYTVNLRINKGDDV